MLPQNSDGWGDFADKKQQAALREVMAGGGDALEALRAWVAVDRARAMLPTLRDLHHAAAAKCDAAAQALQGALEIFEPLEARRRELEQLRESIGVRRLLDGTLVFPNDQAKAQSLRIDADLMEQAGALREARKAVDKARSLRDWALACAQNLSAMISKVEGLAYPDLSGLPFVLKGGDQDDR